MNLFKILALIALYSTSFFSNQAMANVTSYATDVPLLDDGHFIDSSSTGDSLFIEGQIMGLPKFDPAQGTLTGITIDLALSYNHFTEIGANAVEDDSLPHSAGYSTSFTDIELIYNTSNIGHVIGSYALQSGFDCSASPGDEACSDVFFDSDMWGEQGLGDLTELSGYSSTDFVGTGEEVTALELWFVAYEYAFQLDNIDEIFLEESFEIDSGSITIYYEYSPVPLPAASWLFITGILGFLSFSRKR